jgi:NAD(P)-dependent dehydrogenase (short-subunit alcohol dehydrogenase family)
MNAKMKNVFITNVLSEEGKALAGIFRDKGWYVYGVDEQEDFENSCDRFIQFDSDEFVRSAFYRVQLMQSFDDLIPRLDTLLCLSILRRQKSMLETSLDQWTQTLNYFQNLPFLLSKYFFERLKIANGNITTISLLHQPQKSILPISKFALQNTIALTKALSEDFDGNVRVNAILSSEVIWTNIDIQSNAESASPSNVIERESERLPKLKELAWKLSTPEYDFTNGVCFHL